MQNPTQQIEIPNPEDLLEPQPPQDRYIPPSFPKDQTLDVKFPVTEVVYTFKAADLLRGRLDLRWSYPSPVPTVNELPTLIDRLDQYYNLLGKDAVLDIIESHLSSLCQFKWKQATKSSEGDILKAAELFAKNFYEVQSRESTSADGLTKQAQKYMKLFAEEKSRHGLTDLAKEYHSLFKEYNSKAQAQLLVEMQKMMAASD